ncbi:hypothetical protein VNO78_10380 [Psophocarpus tetragonolobus]|uniref:Uncharacterized protein n=1 Tax=Psophocarpus tetragonolobus TaxID=3891 RepID=A0AAN9SM88_PSOTE
MVVMAVEVTIAEMLALINNNALTIARNVTEKSCLKMVIAKRISITSLHDCSLRLSTSASRREPKNTLLVNCHRIHIKTKPTLRRSNKLILEVAMKLRPACSQFNLTILRCWCRKREAGEDATESRERRLWRDEILKTVSHDPAVVEETPPITLSDKFF